MVMGSRIGLNDLVAIGGPPAAEDVRELASLGYKSVIDLSEGAEPDTLGHDEERSLVEQAGMQYRHLPVPSDLKLLAQSGFVQKAHRGVAEAPAPVYLHDSDGRRAALLGAIHVGVEEGWPPEQVPDRAAELSGESLPAELREFIQQYAAEHRRRDA